MAKNKDKIATTPIGSKAVMSSNINAPLKLTDNFKDWATVANIPVPPDSKNRNFNKPLGAKLVAFAVNPNELIETVAEEFEPELAEEERGAIKHEILPKKPPTPPTSEPMPNLATKTIEINWYGALLSIACSNVVYQPKGSTAGGEGWLFLELPINPKTKTANWVPPVAKLYEDGRIATPEFDCMIEDLELRCQILNISLVDSVNQNQLLIFRVI